MNEVATMEHDSEAVLNAEVYGKKISYKEFKENSYKETKKVLSSDEGKIVDSASLLSTTPNRQADQS